MKSNNEKETKKNAQKDQQLWGQFAPTISVGGMRQIFIVDRCSVLLWGVSSCVTWE